MNESPVDWQELSSVWQEDAAELRIEEIENYLARERRRLRIAAAGEVAGLAFGFAAAAWTAVFAPYRGLGVVLALFALASVYLSWRLRRAPMPAGSAALAISLKESLAREDWIEAQLRFGRSLNYVALVGLTFAAAALLRFVRPVDLVALWAACGGIAFVSGSLAWNAILARRARVRRRRLEHMSEGLEK